MGFWIFIVIGMFVFYVIKCYDSVIKVVGRELFFFIFIGIVLCYMVFFVCLVKFIDFICVFCCFIGSMCFIVCYVLLLMKINCIYCIFNYVRYLVVRLFLIRFMF